MKPLLCVLFLLLVQKGSAQSLDYISVRKKNGRVVKNFYTGSRVLLQTTYGAYIEGPIEKVANDTAFIRIYDVRIGRTFIGSIIRDTITSTLVSLDVKEIQRIYLYQKQGFFQRRTGPLLLIAGSGYLTLNLLNGTFFDNKVPGAEKGRTAVIGGSLFGLGYLFNKLFSSDGFSKKSHRIVYVDL